MLASDSLIEPYKGKLGHSDNRGDSDGSDGSDDSDHRDDNSKPKVRLDYTPDIIDEVVGEFPPMRSVFHAITHFPGTFGRIDMSASEDFGVPISVLLRAAWRTFGLAVKQGSIANPYSILSYSDTGKAYAISQEFPPWYYNPSTSDFERMGRVKMMRSQGYRYWLKPHIDGEGSRGYTQGKYKFSAASKAIHFLSQCPKQVRMQLRRICLHETAISAALPECHALGLIPFCQENPCLYIERRVNIWRTLFRGATGDFALCWQPDQVWEMLSSPEKTDAEESANGARLSSKRLSLLFASWAMEALELVRSGMPRRSFKLVFDGDPAPQLAARVFRDVIQRDATWQRLVEMETAPWSEPQDEDVMARLSLKKKIGDAYFFDGFSDMVDDIAGKRHELIECTFETGPSPWDLTALSRQFSGFESGETRFEAICETYFEEPFQYFDMPHPLPSWRDLVAEDILPAFFDSDEELEHVIAIDLSSILGGLAPGADEDEAALIVNGGPRDEDDEDGNDDESPPGDDSEAAEDARSYDGGENDA